MTVAGVIRLMAPALSSGPNSLGHHFSLSGLSLNSWASTGAAASFATSIMRFIVVFIILNSSGGGLRQPQCDERAWKRRAHDLHDDVLLALVQVAHHPVL